MKKMFLLFFAALCLAGMSLFVACAPKNEEPVFTDFMISDFESDAEYLTMYWANTFGKVDASSEYVVSGEHSARMEIHGMPEYGEEKRPYVTIYTESDYVGKVDYTDTLWFEVSVFNDCDKDVKIAFSFYSNSLESGKGGWYETQNFTAKAKEWNVLKIEIDRIYLSKNWGLSKISQFQFTFENLSEGEAPRVLYFDKFIAHTTSSAIPAFDLEVKHVVADVGSNYTVPPLDGAEWTISKDDIALADKNNALSLTLEKGVYRIDYTKLFDGISSRVKTLYVHAENAELTDLNAQQCREEPARPSTRFAGVTDTADNAIFEGKTALKMSGARDPDVPYGFTWNTGITDGIESIVLYVYNARDVAVRMWPEYQWEILPQGTFFDANPKTWTRVEITGDFNSYAEQWQNGSPVKRNMSTGEWSLFVPIQIWDSNYEVYLHAMVETYKEDVPVYEVDKTSAYAQAGSQYTLPNTDGETSRVVKFNGENLVDVGNTITAEVGVYLVEYYGTVRDVEELLIREHTVYCEKGTPVQPEIEDFVTEGDRPNNVPLQPDISSDKTLISNSNVRLHGSTVNQNEPASDLYGITYKTGIIDRAITNAVFYIYNAGNMNIAIMTGGKEPFSDAFWTVAKPNEWTRLELSGGFYESADAWGNGSRLKRDEITGEWQFFIETQFWTVTYDFYIESVIETGFDVSDIAARETVFAPIGKRCALPVYPVGESSCTELRKILNFKNLKSRGLNYDYKRNNEGGKFCL